MLSFLFFFYMSVYMTADIDSYRKPCNMCRICININCKRSSCSSKPAGSDSKAVDFHKHLLFHVFYIWNVRMYPHFSCQSFFCHQRTFFKGSPDSYSNYHRRTGIRTGVPDCRQNRMFYSLNTFCRLQHKYTAHIFASKSFWCYFYLHLISCNDFGMEHCRCIIFCIFTD